MEQVEHEVVEEVVEKQSYEQSIVKKYRKTIWRKFVEAVYEYQMIQDGDVIGVCISGGKDSMLLAKVMQHFQKYGKINFEVKYIVMDPGYAPENRQRIIDNAELLNIPIQIFDSGIYDTVFNIEKNPCYLCARMRRGYLYSYAQELGCNKIALGHHFDDVIETTLMSVLYGAEFKTMMPKLHSDNFEGLELIRPFYLVKETNIIDWVKYHNLEFIRCACRFTDVCSIDGEVTAKTSKRAEMKQMIKEMKKHNPNVDINIFRSLHKVNLDTIIGYSKEGEYTSFLDEYDQKTAK